MTAIEFKNCIQLESKNLRHYAYQLTKNTEDSNDLVQETMLKALIYQDKFMDGTNLKGWLYTIMRNTFINNYRRMLKRNTFIERNDFLPMTDSHYEGPSVQNNGDASFVRRDIEKAVQSLPASLKKPFTMNHAGFKYQEIAEILHIPIGTVKTRIFVARRFLREKLMAYGKAYGLEHN